MNKDILKLAIPSIITNVSVPLLSSVDTALVGHLEHQYYLGGVAIGAMIFNFIFWAFGFLRMGTTGLTAQAYGEGNQRECGLILSRAVLVAVIAGSALILLQWLIQWIAFQSVTASAEVEAQAAIYYNLRIWSAPAALFIYAVQGWFLGMQNARYPMILAVFINCLTIGLDVFFLQVLHMKVAGVAMGTLIAQYAGATLAIALFYAKYRQYARDIVRKQILEIAAIRRFFAVNRDIFLRTLLLIATYTFFTAKSAQYGDTVLSANTILMQLWMILAYGVDGFAYAAESLVGRFVGARDRIRLKTAVYYIFVWAIILGLIVSLVYLLFGESIVRLFTADNAVVATAMTFFVWTILAPLINGVCFVWDGVFIGATATRAMLISMAVATVVFYFPVYYLAEPKLGNHSLWLAMLTYMAVRGITLTFYAPKAIFRKVVEIGTP
jgi:MATE family multidrug resistance protein